MNGEQPPKKDRTWLVACGIGCGAMIVLAGLVAAGGYLAVSRVMAEGSKEAGAMLREEHAKAEAAGRFSDEEAAVFDELVALIQPEGSSYAVTSMALAMMMLVLEEEGEQSEGALAIAKELRDLLRTKPNAGMIDVVLFMPEFPEFAEEFQKAMEGSSAPSRVPPGPHATEQPDAAKGE